MAIITSFANGANPERQTSTGDDVYDDDNTDDGDDGRDHDWHPH